MSDAHVSSVRLSDGAIVKLEYHKELSSTSALAKKYANAGYPDRYAILTEKQLSSPITGTKLAEGEGEHGVFVSVILRPAFFPSQAGLLGPLSAVALLNALEAHTDKALGLGWISNVYCRGMHVGGVTMEAKLNSFSSYEYLIVNFAVRLDEKSFPPRLADMVRQVFEPDNASVSMIIAKTILSKFFKAYSQVRTPEKYMDIYKRRFLLMEKRIYILRDGKKRPCRVVDLDKTSCALTVEERGGARTVITSPSTVVIPKKIRVD